MEFYSHSYLTIFLVDAPKIDTDLLWDLTILLGGIGFFYFLIIFFFKNKISNNSAKTTALKTSLSPMISEFIFYDETGSKEDKSLYVNLKVQVRDMLKDDFKRKTISEILLELQKDVSGKAQDRLFDLFQDLDLHRDSYKKLKSWRWERISSGIQELTRMRVNEAYGFLTKFINDKRTTIRKQAEIAIITLDPEGINYFLDTTRNKISEWQQLKFIEVLSNKKNFVPPSFRTWLVSKNKYVVLFSLRLIKYYDQNDANVSLVELVKHQDNQIKKEAIDCIKGFYLTSALPTLQQIFWGCSTDIKIAILDAIANLGTPQDIAFLQSIGKKERNYSVTSKALGAINAIVPDSVLPTEGITDIAKTTVPVDIVEVEEELAKEPTADIDSAKEQKTIEAPTQTSVFVDKNKASATKPPIAVQGTKQDLIVSDNTGRQDMVDGEQAEQAGSTVDVNSIEVVFSTDFLPLVTAPENRTVETQGVKETDINTIDVVYEEILEKYSPDNNSINAADPNNIEVVLDSEFLPFVVADDRENKKTHSLNALEVVFETVTVPVPTEITASEVNIEELEVQSKTLGTSTHEKENVLEHIEVVFEEVSPENVEISFEIDETESAEFDFEIIFNNGQPPLRIPKIETCEIHNIEVKFDTVMTAEADLAKIPVVFETVHGDDNNENQELPDWLLNEIANKEANFNNREHLKMEGPEWEAKESRMMDEIQNYIKNIPTSEHTNDEVADIIALLDDIELFGDEREIPLLQELMQKEDKVQTKERIDGIMKRFMGTDAYGQGLDDASSYSVFEELFRNCDNESKLILLDEIILIGDEKEARFLEQLLQDPNEKIRKKASTCLKALNERIKRVETGQESKDADDYERFINLMELNPPKSDEPSYFQIDFEIDTEEEETEQEKLDRNEKGFLNFFNKLVNKLTK